MKVDCVCFNKLNNNRGLTLIELIIAFALTGIIASVAISMNIFSNRVVNKGESKYNVQSEVNLASEIITNNVRYATGIELLDSSAIVPNSGDIANDDAYVFFETVSGKPSILLRDKTGTRTIIVLDSLNMAFSTAVGDKSMYFHISGSHKGEEFEIESDIVPQNMLIRNETIQDSASPNTPVKLRIRRDGILAVASTNLYVASTSFIGTVGGSVTGSANVTGGSGTYTFSVSSSTRLPYGTSINSSNGQITGSPIEAGEFSVTVIVEDTSTPVKKGSCVYSIDITGTDPNAPEVSSVSITRDPINNEILIPNYTYTDPNSHPEGSTCITWFRGENENGLGIVEIAISDTYTLTSADNGKYIFLQIIPANDPVDPLLMKVGPPSFAIMPVFVPPGGNAAPTASSVTITGSVRIGNVVTGNYIYEDTDVPADEQGISFFKWYRGSESNGSNKVEIPGANSKEHVLNIDDKGLFIFFEVTPVALTGTTTGSPSLSLNHGKIKP